VCWNNLTNVYVLSVSVVVWYLHFFINQTLLSWHQSLYSEVSGDSHLAFQRSCHFHRLYIVADLYVSVLLAPASFCHSWAAVAASQLRYCVPFVVLSQDSTDWVISYAANANLTEICCLCLCWYVSITGMYFCYVIMTGVTTQLCLTVANYESSCFLV